MPTKSLSPNVHIVDRVRAVLNPSNQHFLDANGGFGLSVWTSSGRCFVIAEIGLNHNGSLPLALELIGQVALAGADAVKFQKRDVASLAVKATLDAPDDRFPSLGATYREIRESLEFGLDEFRILKKHAESLGLIFFATPFDISSVRFLEKVGVGHFKIASHGVTNLPLISAVAETGKPTIISTGMASQDEVDEAVGLLLNGGVDLAIMHCVSSYPTESSEARLDLIGQLSNRYRLPTGYSGHEIGRLPTLIAVGLGAKLVERHITLDQKMEGFDHHLSLTPNELGELVAEIRQIESMFGAGDKQVTEKELLTRNKYQVSAVAARNIVRGEILRSEDIAFKNPGLGLTPSQARSLVGQITKVDIPEDSILNLNDFEVH